MNELIWDLFSVFFMIGLVSFGGGYAMIPLIQQEVVRNYQWLNAQQFTDVIAVAGMSPGPIATNTAIFIGYNQMGIWGAIISALGMILPSLFIILGVSAIFYKIQGNEVVKSAFYGLRAIITGLIVYAALLFAANNGLFSSVSWHTLSLIVIYAASLVALVKYRLHPVFVILLSGLVGVTVYG